MPGRSVYEADWEPWCDSPVEVTRYVTSKDRREEVMAMEVHMKVPCRHCPKCLQRREILWKERALAEIEASERLGCRTWFVTLTFSPQHLAGVLLEAESAELRAIERAAYRHVQRYLKRLRKAVEGRFRYLAVYERGEENGRSHYHLLLHEQGPKPVTKAVLEEQWRSFVHARLVSSEEGRRTARYVCKYTTKALEIRPRASSRYGLPSPPKNP